MDRLSPSSPDFSQSMGPEIPVISVTSSSGSSSLLRCTEDEGGGSDDSANTHASSSPRNSLTRLASRASDIQSYASKYIDSIRSKSRTKSSTTSPTTNPSPKSRSPSTSRAVSPFSGFSGGSSSGPSKMTIIGHRLAPTFVPAPPSDVSSNPLPFKQPSFRFKQRENSVRFADSDSHRIKGRKDSQGFESDSRGVSKNQQKHHPFVEVFKESEAGGLIDPSQVVVTQGEVLVAHPILLPLERLRLKDQEISNALEEKHRLISEIFDISHDQYDQSQNGQQPGGGDTDAKDVLLATLTQAKKLSDLVNSGLSICEADVATLTSEIRHENIGQRSTPNPLMIHGLPADQLIGITTSINQHLTTFLAIIQERDDERDRLKRELKRSQDQVRELLSQPSHRPSYWG